MASPICTLQNAPELVLTQNSAIATIAPNDNVTTITATSSSVRSFHTTAPTLAERRQRRRRTSTNPMAESEEEDLSDAVLQGYKPVTDIGEFRKLAKEELQKLVTSIGPMKAMNDPFKVDLSDDMMTIELDPANGSFVVEIDEENLWLTIQSPVSGAQSYFYSKKKQEWVGAQDYHSMEGLFVRDLIRLCKGVPKL